MRWLNRWIGFGDSGGTIIYRYIFCARRGLGLRRAQFLLVLGGGCDVCENLFFGLSVFAPRREVHKARIWAELLRPFRVVQSAAPAGGGLQLVGARCYSPLVANSLKEMNGPSFCDSQSRASRTPAPGRPATRRSASKIAIPPRRSPHQGKKSRVAAAGCWGSSSLLSSASRSCLFREATQLKTVGAFDPVAGAKPFHIIM